MFAALVAFQLIVSAWIILRIGGETATLWVDDISVAIAPVAAGVVALLAMRRFRGTQASRAWLCIAIGMFGFAFGDITWSIQELSMDREVPFPSVSDIGYLAGYVPIFLGLLMMPQSPATGLRRLKLTLDVLVATVAIGIISLHLIIGPLISDDSTTGLAYIVGLAYPFADLAVIGAVTILIARATPGSPTIWLFCLGAAFGVTAFSDSFYTYLLSKEAYATGSYIDIGWLLGYNLVTVSALICLAPRAQLNRQRAEEPMASFWQTAAIYMPVVPLGAVVLTSAPQMFTIAVFGVVLLMFVRQLVSIHENLLLNRQLKELAGELESRVKQQQMRLISRASEPPHELPSVQPRTGDPASTR